MSENIFTYSHLAPPIQECPAPCLNAIPPASSSPVLRTVLWMLLSGIRPILKPASLKDFPVNLKTKNKDCGDDSVGRLPAAWT